MHLEGNQRKLAGHWMTVSLRTNPFQSGSRGCTQYHPQNREPTPAVNAVELPMENQEKDQREIAVPEEISEKHKWTEVPIPKTVDNHPVVLMEPRNLPFAKNNNLWKILEENDTLKKIPHNLHFRPLEQAKEPLREGKAIGYMEKNPGALSGEGKD